MLSVSDDDVRKITFLKSDITTLSNTTRANSIHGLVSCIGITYLRVQGKNNTKSQFRHIKVRKTRYGGNDKIYYCTITLKTDTRTVYITNITHTEKYKHRTKNIDLHKKCANILQ